MQAIVVRFVGPSNTKPSRWRVLCATKSILVSKGRFCDTNDDTDARNAAYHLRDLCGWKGDLVEGGLPNGDRVFVFVDK